MKETKIDIDEMLRNEWRELKFYYELDDTTSTSEWKFYGSIQGLYNLVKLLDDYVSDTKNYGLSEHEHYGPYSYLKIMTWTKAEITADYIGGSINDLIELRNALANKLKATQIGDTFNIDKDFGTSNTATATFYVMPEDFDPVSMDTQLHSTERKQGE